MAHDHPNKHENEAWRLLEGDESENNHEHNHISESQQLAIANVVVGWFGVALCLASGIFVGCYRKRPIVALGQPPFLGLICAGSLLVASVNLFENPELVHLMEDVTQVSLDGLCIVRMWCFSVGLVVVYMSFVCKLWRAERVCQFRKNRIVHVHHVIGPFCFILLVEIGILIGQTIVSPPFWSSEIPAYPRDPGRTDVMEKCYMFQIGDPTNMAFNASSVILIILCQAITMWMSYRTRNIREDISDSRRIFQTTVLHMIISVPSVLQVNGIGLHGYSTYVYQLCYMFLLAVSSMGFLILPKVHCVCYQRTHGRLPSYARTVGGVHVSMSGPSPAPTPTTSTNTTGTQRSVRTESRAEPGATETETERKTETESETIRTTTTRKGKRKKESIDGRV